MPPTRLGERLVADGHLSPSTVERALGFQKSTAPGVRLGSILLTWDLIGEETLLATLATLHQCEGVDGKTLAAAPIDVVRMLPASHAIRLNAVSYALERSRLRTAFVDPSDVQSVDEVAALTGHVCVPAVVTELRLLQAHRRFYGRALPTELPAVRERTDAARPSRTGHSESPPSPVSVIPIGREPGPEPALAPIATIEIPDLPIPPRPTGARATPAAAPPPLTAREIGDIALASVPVEFPRAILFAVERDSLAGWRARGIDATELSNFRLASAEPSVFAGVLETGAPHLGRVDESLWPRPMARLFEGPAPCAVFPVHSSRGVAALLYADRRGAPMRFEDTALLARAAADIAALVEQEPLRERSS
jgi:MshEN domain